MNNSNQNAYTPPVRYLDAPALYKPIGVPPSAYPVIIGLAIIAAVIATFAGVQFLGHLGGAPERQAALIEQEVKRGVNIDPPNLMANASLDNVVVIDQLRQQGFEVVDMRAAGFDDIGFGPVGADLPEGSLDIVKIPSDMTIQDCMLDAGALRSLDPVNSARFLSGSWRLTAMRGDGMDMRLRFVDFTSGTVELAVRNAVQMQGWQDSVAGELATDDAGNMFLQGSIVAADGTYSWTVSACPLDEVVTVQGLPTAFYVVERVER